MPLLPTTPTPTADRPKANSSFAVSESGAFYKNIVLAGLSVIAAFLSGYFYFRYLNGETNAWPMAAFLAAFCVLSAVYALVRRASWSSAGIIFVEALAIAISFILSRPFMNFAAATAAAFVFFLWGYFESRREAQEGLRIRFFKIAHLHINKVVTGAILMAVIFYFPVAMAQSPLVSQTSLESFFRWTGGFIKIVYPDFDPQSSVGAVVAKFAASKAAQDPSFAGLSQNSQQLVIRESVSSTIANLNSNLKMRINQDGSVQSAIYDFLTSTIAGWKEKFGIWFFVGWAVLIFLIARTIGFFFSLIASFLAFIVFYLLVAARVIRIGAEARMKETAQL